MVINKLTIFGLVVLLFLCNVSESATLKWNNGVNGDYITASNWNLNRIPVKTDIAYVDSNSSVTIQNITSSPIFALAGDFNVLNSQLNVKNSVVSIGTVFHSSSTFSYSNSTVLDGRMSFSKSNGTFANSNILPVQSGAWSISFQYGVLGLENNNQLNSIQLYESTLNFKANSSTEFTGNGTLLITESYLNIQSAIVRLSSSNVYITSSQFDIYNSQLFITNSFELQTDSHLNIVGSSLEILEDLRIFSSLEEVVNTSSSQIIESSVSLHSFLFDSNEAIFWLLNTTMELNGTAEVTGENSKLIIQDSTFSTIPQLSVLSRTVQNNGPSFTIQISGTSNFYATSNTPIGSTLLFQDNTPTYNPMEMQLSISHQVDGNLIINNSQLWNKTIEFVLGNSSTVQIANGSVVTFKQSNIQLTCLDPNTTTITVSDSNISIYDEYSWCNTTNFIQNSTVYIIDTSFSINTVNQSKVYSYNSTITMPSSIALPIQSTESYWSGSIIIGEFSSTGNTTFIDCTLLTQGPIDDPSVYQFSNLIIDNSFTFNSKNLNLSTDSENGLISIGYQGEILQSIILDSQVTNNGKLGYHSTNVTHHFVIGRSLTSTPSSIIYINILSEQEFSDVAIGNLFYPGNSTLSILVNSDILDQSESDHIDFTIFTFESTATTFENVSVSWTNSSHYYSLIHNTTNFVFRIIKTDSSSSDSNSTSSESSESSSSSSNSTSSSESSESSSSSSNSISSSESSESSSSSNSTSSSESSESSSSSSNSTSSESSWSSEDGTLQCSFDYDKGILGVVNEGDEFIVCVSRGVTECKNVDFTCQTSDVNATITCNGKHKITCQSRSIQCSVNGQICAINYPPVTPTSTPSITPTSTPSTTPTPTLSISSTTADQIQLSNSPILKSKIYLSSLLMILSIFLLF
ncbi:hypothetical protein DLAC_05781 [Tieghemostelium lacteum]|uniref:Uncharacterized protein n=1 Tax=Tieghemostelium lacteum TaxID=361077 RepID=A0A151ZGV3_TIELA|nr:hypothetical protein DLAC_05781 [Tieghemostelium lacteum]|eukprot:KYQ93147.1 hypothetical protein DLAC_05781 [Tieghemostelium lacteum]